MRSASPGTASRRGARPHRGLHGRVGKRPRRLGWESRGPRACGRAREHRAPHSISRRNRRGGTRGPARLDQLTGASGEGPASPKGSRSALQGNRPPPTAPWARCCRLSPSLVQLSITKLCQYIVAAPAPPTSGDWPQTIDGRLRISPVPCPEQTSRRWYKPRRWDRAHWPRRFQQLSVASYDRRRPSPSCASSRCRHRGQWEPASHRANTEPPVASRRV